MFFFMRTVIWFPSSNPKARELSEKMNQIHRCRHPSHRFRLDRRSPRRAPEITHRLEVPRQFVYIDHFPDRIGLPEAPHKFADSAELPVVPQGVVR